MSQRQLPVKRKDSAYLWFSSLLSLFFVAATQAFLLYAFLGGILAGDAILITAYGLASLLFLWMTGSVYLALPLNLYFHSKYRSDSNYARVDMVHRRVLKLLKAAPFRRHLAIAVSISNLGILRLCQGYYDSAADLFTEAESYLKSTRGTIRDMSMIIFYNNLAVAYLRQNKCIEAELIGTKALEIAEQAQMQKKYKKLSGPPLSVLAAASLRLNDLDRSMEYAKKALEIYENAPVPSGYTESSFVQARVFCLFGMAACCLKQDKEKDGIEYYEQGMKFCRQSPQLLTTLALEPLNLLSNELMNRKQFERAEELLELAYKIGHDNPYHPDAKQSLNYFEKLLLLTQRNEEISDMRSWLRMPASRLIAEKK